MKVIAKVTSWMEGNTEDIWIRKGNIYKLKKTRSEYKFIDEAGKTHFIYAKNFDRYFELIKEGKQ